MALLDKLQILGIRNFGVDDGCEQKIQFHSPMTLVLGQNGCGKTTIIEALKYACCGEFPPHCNKGSGFVHDPKVAKRADVKAQVKLSLKMDKDKKLTVCRTVQSTQRATKVEFKTLEPTLTVENKDQPPQSISGRCADIDVEVCYNLGVSKAVLSNVILCHQEDSDWPLDEPKKLKERFDGIFDATKYNKSVDHMRKLRKERMNDLKVLTEQLKHVDFKRQEVEKKKKTQAEIEAKITKNEDVVKEDEEKLKPIVTRLDEIKTLEANWKSQFDGLDLKKKRVKEIQKDIREMKAGLKIFEGSDEELAEAITEFAKQLELKEAELGELEKDLKAKRTEEQEFIDKFVVDEAQVLQLNSEEKLNETRINKRVKLLTPLVEQLDITEYSSTEFEKVHELIELIDTKLVGKKEEITTISKEHDEDEQQKQEAIDAARESKVKLEQEVKTKTQQLKDVKNEVKKAKKEVDECNTSTSNLQLVQEQIERNTKDYDLLLTTVNVDEVNAQIGEETKKRDLLEVDSDSIDREVSTLQRLSNTHTELDLKKESLMKHESEILRLNNKHEDALNNLFKDDKPTENLKGALDKVKKELTTQLKELNTGIKTAQKKVTELTTNIKYQKEKVDGLEKELETKTNQVHEICGDDAFDEVLANETKTLERLREDKGNFSSTKYMYTRFIEQMEKDEPCCPVCKRDFPEKDPANAVVAELKELIEKFPLKLKEIEEELKQSQQKYNKLIQLQSVNARIIELRDTEIPKAKETLDNLENDLKTSTEKLEALQADILVPQTSQEQLQSVASDVTLLDKSQSEAKKLRVKITDLEATMSTANTTRNLQEALSEQERIKSELASSRRQVDVLQKRVQSFNTQKQSLMESKNKLVEKQLQIEKSVQGFSTLKEKYDELTVRETKLTEEVDALNVQLDPLKKDLTAAMDAKNLSKRENKKKMEKLQSDLQTLEKNFQELKNIQQQIDEYEKNDNKEKLKEVNAKLAELKIERDLHTKAKNELQHKVDYIKKFLANQTGYNRELKDNQRLRGKETEAEDLRKEIEEMSNALQNENINTVLNEKKKLSDNKNSVEREKHKAEGALTELRRNLENMKTELAKDVNVTAHERYLHKLYECRVKERVIQDIQKYAEAIDYAMMTYHTAKMKEINMRLKELWRSIYRGNDIDYIEIRTEQNNPTGKDVRRTYNYRVVQVKNGQAIDMRGRCSAGQRVLTCLIVRIALSETFSRKCGILALDEPTTNLDRENIQSLSAAIKDLVEQNKIRKNFQLIIITHDRQFLESLSGIDRIDTHYVVSRDNTGRSIIKEVVAQFD